MSCFCICRKKKEYVLPQITSISGKFAPRIQPTGPEEDNGVITQLQDGTTPIQEPETITRPVELRKTEENDRKNSADSEIVLSRRRSAVIPTSVVFDENTAAIPKHAKEPEDEQLIKSAIEKDDFLNKVLSGDRLKAIIDAMYSKDIDAKEIVIKEGDNGSHMYISAKGKFQISIKGKTINEFDNVTVFGELAILYNAKRLATIKALTKGKVWVLDSSAFHQIMVQYSIEEQNETVQFLQEVNGLNVVGPEILQHVAGLLKTEFFVTDKIIVRQGDKGDKFYIIRAGSVTVTKENEGVVGKLTKGNYFGELALIKEDCRQATVTADAPGAECLTLTRQEFINHFGNVDFPMIKIPKKDSVNNELEEQNLTEHSNIDLNDLVIVGTLGVGGFGRVELVQHKQNKTLVFALKYLKKIEIVNQQQQEHVYNEKNIQISSNCPFIVRLYKTYKDNKFVYFLMESCLGGDLWGLLQKQKLKRFDEKTARFIGACVLESLEYLHKKGIVYRDLKPENLLIDKNGYVKLTDFGFAKKLNTSRGRTFTFAGTPEYVAPEIVQNRGHDRGVDCWAYGILIYELLVGRTPFRTNDKAHLRTYNKILSGIDNVQFPSFVQAKARSLIEKLCRPVSSDRLGMQRGGLKDIKNHRWYVGFDWAKLAACEMPSPFKPKLKSPTDMSHFDPFSRDTDIDPPDEMSGWDIKF